jgi:co-chaperonin GroES (HSP10)
MGTMPRLVPLHDRVLIHRDELARVSAGRSGVPIVLPGNRRTEDELRSMMTVQGEVVAVGPEVEDLQEGQRVVYRWYTGDEVKINDARCVFLPRSEVLAIVQEGT